MMAIIISGPTASSKSNLALQLGQFKDIAIINADSMQIYQDLPILSAQPTAQQQQQVLHYLYGFLPFDQNFSVMLWLEKLKEKLDLILAQNKLPVIVGGTGMYISRLVFGISEIPEISEQIKQQAQDLYHEVGAEKFIEILLKMGQDQNSLKTDKQRLLRQYQILKQTGKTMQYFQKLPKKFIIDPKIFTHINLEIDREQLYQNCNLRFKNMLESGAIEEVAALLTKNPNDNLSITKTLGFFEIKQYLQNNISKEQMIKQAAMKTRNYAKRQLTWFRNQFQDKKTFTSSKQALQFLLK